MVTTPDSSLSSMTCFRYVCRRSSRSVENPTLSGLTAVMSSVRCAADGAGWAGNAVTAAATVKTVKLKRTARRQVFFIVLPRYGAVDCTLLNRTLYSREVKSAPACYPHRMAKPCERASAPKPARPRLPVIDERVRRPRLRHRIRDHLRLGRL